MEHMGILEEWLRSIVAEGTRKHHQRAMRRFVAFMGMSPEEILEVRRAQFGKSKQLETKVIEFFKWLQETQNLSQNSARSETIGIQSFFSYYNVRLQLRGKLPDTHMKLDAEKLTVEDLKLLWRFNDLRIKTWIAFARDCPARIGDLLAIRREQIKPEFLIKSEKANVIGKVFLSEGTIELFEKYWKNVRKSPYAFSSPHDQTNINRMLKGAAQKAGIKKKITQHSFRKLWITSAINLGLPDTVWKILSFKSVPQATLTYFLDREDLRDYWKKVTTFLSLEPQINNRVGDVKKTVDLLKETLTTLEKENLILKTRIDNLQSNAVTLEDRLNEIGDFAAHVVEFGRYTEEEKEALRRKYNIKEFPEEERQLMHILGEIRKELQKEKSYLDEKDEKEVTRRFAAIYKKREKAKKKKEER